MTLRALQSAANNQNTQAPMTWQALSHAGRNFGAPTIDYDRFAARWETDPILKALVDKFDGAGLVVKTNEKDKPPRTSHKEREVSKMAKRATNKNRKFD
jgi:hypothetical protein